MRTTAQILDAIYTDGSGGNLPALLCVDCTTVLDLSATGMALINDDGHQGVLGASGPLATRLEDLQFELGEGPGLDAFRANSPILEPDLSVNAMTRWPGFGSSALSEGVRAVLALPLQAGATPMGALCLYRSTPGRWDDDGTASALAYADAAVAVLLRLQAQPGPALHPDLAAPVAYRAVVHQATGFLAVQASVGLAEALLLLRAHAYASERPLLQVAREVLAGTLRIQPGEGEDD
ncbi:GAF domain-containing protein [Nocardioides bizhenqiangii]|uniref:GAF domain-containing protein n=1 Tax=Nocardioides bizhenqiangii TaxID=3095076 RepID=A0ABZ0ZSW2_9ACTN|nr:GAF domain-containing protein [Nocardioides sp. HM61]WQQ27354.1 GAF domain-containing protein [Nocardioides sp. HM61]